MTFLPRGYTKSAGWRKKNAQLLNIAMSQLASLVKKDLPFPKGSIAHD